DFLFLEVNTEIPLEIGLSFVIKITHFCHVVNRFFGQRISGIDKKNQKSEIRKFENPATRNQQPTFISR
ncbi:MAG: hypothetical protein RBT38_13730, partial [Bacteroidales bacterium]|nr:hypothetical protein [Bacteroidales bacterium]